VTAWRPRVSGVVEVLHARFAEHAYPMHVHDAWTLLIVDDGAVRYDLERHRRHGTRRDVVTLLPPHVPHNGAPATPQGFRKRVVYLDLSRLDESLVGPAVDGPDLPDPVLRHRVGRLHTALARPGDELEAAGAWPGGCANCSTSTWWRASRWTRRPERWGRIPPTSCGPSAPSSASRRTST
jgi:hypothetical protein